MVFVPTALALPEGLLVFNLLCQLLCRFKGVSLSLTDTASLRVLTRLEESCFLSTRRWPLSLLPAHPTELGCVLAVTAALVE